MSHMSFWFKKHFQKCTTLCLVPFWKCFSNQNTVCMVLDAMSESMCKTHHSPSFGGKNRPYCSLLAGSTKTSLGLGGSYTAVKVSWRLWKCEYLYFCRCDQNGFLTSVFPYAGSKKRFPGIYSLCQKKRTLWFLAPLPHGGPQKIRNLMCLSFDTDCIGGEIFATSGTLTYFLWALYMKGYSYLLSASSSSSPSLDGSEYIITYLGQNPGHPHLSRSISRTPLCI